MSLGVEEPGVEEPGVEEGQPGGKTAWNGGNEGRLVSLQA